MTACKDATLEPSALGSSAFEKTTPEPAASANAASSRGLESVVVEPCRRLLDLCAMGGARTSMLPALILTTCAGAAVYGAAFGAWQGGAGIGYAVIKLPVALLTTAVVAMFLNCAVARVMGLRVGCAQSLRVTLLATAVASLLLGVLAAAAWTLGASFSSTAFSSTADFLARVGAQIGIDGLGLAQIPLVGLAGLAGASVLWHALGRFGRCRRQRRRVFVAWLLVLVSTGGPVIWVLQPWANDNPEQAQLQRTARVALPLSQ